MDGKQVDIKQSVVDRIKQANNILVTVSRNPSVDQLAAAIGLTLALNKYEKHATAVYSGQTPSTIEFLKPQETLEKNTDSLRDFIIGLDKSKADKLRYKVEDDVVRIFITPYRTSISESDLVFSQGDFNVDVVLAVGVHEQEDIDQAITTHGRILHDATVIVLGLQDGINTGTLQWVDTKSSSLSEMAVALVDALDDKLVDNQIATALLTGIVAETERFSNEKTTPSTMSLSAQLMSAGADQQLVAAQLSQPAETLQTTQAPDTQPDTNQEKAEDIAVGEDGSLEIDHNSTASVEDKPGTPAESTDKESTDKLLKMTDEAVVDPGQIKVDEHGNLELPNLQNEPSSTQPGDNGLGDASLPPSVEGSSTNDLEAQLPPIPQLQRSGQRVIAPLHSRDDNAQSGRNILGQLQEDPLTSPDPIVVKPTGEVADMEVKPVLPPSPLDLPLPNASSTLPPAITVLPPVPAESPANSSGDDSKPPIAADALTYESMLSEPELAPAKKQGKRLEPLTPENSETLADLEKDVASPHVGSVPSTQPINNDGHEELNLSDLDTARSAVDAAITASVPAAIEPLESVGAQFLVTPEPPNAVPGLVRPNSGLQLPVPGAGIQGVGESMPTGSPSDQALTMPLPSGMPAPQSQLPQQPSDPNAPPPVPPPMMPPNFFGGQQ